MAEVPSKTFITGATGDVGSQALELLQKANRPVRAMCRRQAQVEKFRERGIDVVQATLDDSVERLSECMRGCEWLFLLTAATPDQLKHNTSAIDAAISAGLKWIVKVSAGDARDEGNTPWVRAHATADQYLQDRCGEQGIAWTILSPSAFMQNLLTEAGAIQKGFLPQTGGHGKAGWVDTMDVAAVTAQVLIDGPAKHHGQNYILTGPQLISFPDIAQAISRQVGHKVRYLHLPGPVFYVVLRATGMDAWGANGLIAQFVEIVRPNKEGVDVSDAIEKITGKPATSIDQFVARNKKALHGFDVLPYLGIATAALVAVAVRALRQQGI